MRFWHVAALATLLLIFGCKQETQVVGGKNRVKYYRTVVSLSPSTTEIVPGKAITMQLIGRTESCNSPSTISGVEVVMKGVKPNYERIKFLNPDVVLLDPDLFTADELKKFQDLKLDVTEVKGNTVDEFVQSLYLLGGKLGIEVTIMDYVDEIRRATQTAKGSAPTNKPKVAIMMPSTHGGHMIAGTKSFLADVIRIGGGEPVGPESTKFEPVSAENFLQWNPSILITAGDPTPVQRDPRFATVDAIKLGQVAGLKDDIVLRKGGRVHELIKRVAAFIKLPKLSN